MENRIDDQMGGREDIAAETPVPNRPLHRIRSGVWWRAIAEHYGPSAAKVSSTLAFAFAIGIGLGVVLASGLDDTANYDHARVHASEAPDGADTAARKAQPEPPYSIAVSVRENTQPPPADVGDIFADVPPEPDSSNTPKAADKGGAEAEPTAPAAPDGTKESTVADSAKNAASTTSVNAEPKPEPVEIEAVADKPQSPAQPDQETKETKAVSLEDAPVTPSPATPETSVDVAVTANLPSDDKAPVTALPDSEDGDAVRGTDEAVNVADDASAGGESDDAARLTGRQLASLPGPRDSTWLRHAVRTPRQPGKAMVAIVIDDLGIDQKRTRRAIAMPGPMTMSFIPYGYNLPKLTKTARAGGHEILLHLPMEPLRQSVDPGPHAMLTTLGADELRKRLAWNLARMEGYVGVNNHMGSRFTAWRPGMRLVMREIRQRGLLFLDSWTNKKSYGIKMARENGVPSAVRDVFIDHDIDAASIGKRLRQLESIARRRGSAIGIGHPYDLTIKLLPAWMAAAEARGIQFVPISTIVQRRLTAG